MLAIVPEHGHKSLVPVTLYHWYQSAIHRETTVALYPAVLATIKGYASLGTFFLRNDFDLPEALSKFSAEKTSPPTSIAQLLTDIIARLEMPSKGSLFQFVSFPIRSSSSDAILHDGLVPIWKWVKPTSTYRKAGCWEVDLQRALEDGEWSGGKDLSLLIREVSEPTWRAFIASHRTATSFASFASFEKPEL